MAKFICPHCNKEIDNTLISKHLASIGGKKSKRKLTTEQALRMVKAREAKRKDQK